jgi:hypothetical protein
VRAAQKQKKGGVEKSEKAAEKIRRRNFSAVFAAVLPTFPEIGMLPTA